MMWYIELLSVGGHLFMFPLAFAHLVIWAVGGIGYFGPEHLAAKLSARRLTIFLGLFSFFFGILGQALGLIDMFDAVEQMGGVSQAMLAGGMKVSFITTIHGIYNLLLGLAFWLINKHPEQSA